MLTKAYYVYILANKKYGTLYVGVTNNLMQRVYQHKTHAVKGFTDKYNLDMLVYFEESASVESVIIREKQIKNWRRQWKINQINGMNPKWSDLSLEFMDSEINSE